MKLKEFIATPEGKLVSQAEWARRIGITRGYFSQLVQEEKTPSIDVAWQIERVTKKKVMMQDWVNDGRDNDQGLRGETPATV